MRSYRTRVVVTVEATLRIDTDHLTPDDTAGCDELRAVQRAAARRLGALLRDLPGVTLCALDFDEDPWGLPELCAGDVAPDVPWAPSFRELRAAAVRWAASSAERRWTRLEESDTAGWVYFRGAGGAHVGAAYYAEADEHCDYRVAGGPTQLLSLEAFEAALLRAGSAQPPPMRPNPGSG